VPENRHFLISSHEFSTNFIDFNIPQAKRKATMLIVAFLVSAIQLHQMPLNLMHPLLPMLRHKANTPFIRPVDIFNSN